MPAPSSKPLTFGTIFSGGGGWDIGFRNAGFQHLFGVENDLTIAGVYEQMVGAVFKESVATVRPSALPNVDVLCASPPCQDYSNANARRTASCDLGSYVPSFAIATRARVVLVENVAPYRYSAALTNITYEMRKLGYQKYTTVFDATWFGVPQSRKRCFAFYSKVGIPELPSPVPHDGWYEHIKDLITPELRAPLPAWQAPFVPDDRPEWVLTHGSACRNGIIRTQREPAWTVIASRQCLTNARLVDPDGNVYRASPRMYARWQTFPDDYNPDCTRETFYRVIGNAVPPTVAYSIAMLFRPLL